MRRRQFIAWAGIAAIESSLASATPAATRHSRWQPDGVGSIGPGQTWSDKAGNAVSTPLAPLTDPTNGLTFPNLNSPPFGGEDFQTNLIMPEPCPFISPTLPVCSIIRPTKTEGVAMGAVNFLTAMGLFIGQPPAFFRLLKELAAEADAAMRGF